MTFDTTVVNQHGEPVLVYRDKMSIRRKDSLDNRSVWSRLGMRPRGTSLNPAPTQTGPRP